MAKYKAFFSINCANTYGSFEGNNLKNLMKDVKDYCKNVTTKNDGAYFHIDDENGHTIVAQRMYVGMRKFFNVG